MHWSSVILVEPENILELRRDQRRDLRSWWENSKWWKWREGERASAGKRRWFSGLLSVYRNTWCGSREDRDGPFSVVLSDRKAGREHKLKYRKFHVNLWKSGLFYGWSSTQQIAHVASPCPWGYSSPIGIQPWTSCCRRLFEQWSPEALFNFNSLVFLYQTLLPVI